MGFLDWLKGNRRDMPKAPPGALPETPFVLKEWEELSPRQMGERLKNATPPGSPEPFQEVAMILSENDPDVKRFWELARGSDREAYAQWVTALVGEEEFRDYAHSWNSDKWEYTLCQSLTVAGYLGYHDYKDPLGDILFSHRRGFSRIGVDLAVYDEIPQHNWINMPFALDLLGDYLPDGMQVALWYDWGDTFYSLLAKRETLETAIPKAYGLGIGISRNYRMQWSAGDVFCPGCDHRYPYAQGQVCPRCGLDRYDFAAWPAHPGYE